jgi:restriction system protein
MRENSILSAFLFLWLIPVGLLVLVYVVRKLSTRLGSDPSQDLWADLRKLDPDCYRHFANLHLPHPDGAGTIQIKHLVASSCGIFVIEKVELRGMISGTDKQSQWSQHNRFRRKRFRNPVNQNQLHVRALMAYLGLPEDRFRPVVFFVGNCRFKTRMPSNVLHGGLLQWIGNHTATLIGNTALNHAIVRLEDLQLSPISTCTALLRSNIEPSPGRQDLPHRLAGLGHGR